MLQNTNKTNKQNMSSLLMSILYNLQSQKGYLQSKCDACQYLLPYYWLRCALLNGRYYIVGL